MTEDEKKALQAAAEKSGADIEIHLEALKGMTKRQRREWFCKARMSDRRLTFRAMAARHRVSPFLLSGAVSGAFRWTPRVIKCLEAELGMALDPFFEHGETRDNGDHKSLDTPEDKE